jgi:hypothetical protein
VNIVTHGTKDTTKLRRKGDNMPSQKIILDVFASLASQEGVCCVNCNDEGCLYCGPSDEVLGVEYDEWLDSIQEIQ